MTPPAPKRPKKNIRLLFSHIFTATPHLFTTIFSKSLDSTLCACVDCSVRRISHWRFVCWHWISGKTERLVPRQWLVSRLPEEKKPFDSVKHPRKKAWAPEHRMITLAQWINLDLFTLHRERVLWHCLPSRTHSLDTDTWYEWLSSEQHQNQYRLYMLHEPIPMIRDKQPECFP